MMSQSHSIKGNTTDKAFQEQHFLWERGASVGAYIDLLHVQAHRNTEGKEKQTKA